MCHKWTQVVRRTKFLLKAKAPYGLYEICNDATELNLTEIYR